MYERLQTLCTSSGITITELCKQITGSSGNLPTWKKGNIKADSIVKICDYFNISADYLLGRIENPNLNTEININNSANNNSVNIDPAPAPDSTTQQLADTFNQLSFEDKIKAMNYVLELKNKE